MSVKLKAGISVSFVLIFVSIGVYFFRVPSVMVIHNKFGDDITVKNIDGVIWFKRKLHIKSRESKSFFAYFSGKDESLFEVLVDKGVGQNTASCRAEHGRTDLCSVFILRTKEGEVRLDCGDCSNR